MRPFLSGLLALAIAITPIAARAQQPTTPEQLLARMTVEERIGQLFIVTFFGNTADAGTEIRQLIASGRVGGVILRAENDNFLDGDTPAGVLALANQLQAIAVETAAQPRPGPAGGQARAAPFIPLWIGLQHEGGGYPYSQIYAGLTALPDPMAIGATWRPDKAEAIGRLAGTELSALGINLVIGPAPDVLNEERTLQGAVDQGTRTFGSSPWWVGEMAAGYYRGLAQGANGRMAVVAPNFPGHGSSNRDWNLEIPTVRKTFQQLTEIDLIPYQRLVRASELTPLLAGLQTAHIRFQGFQEQNPISFDRTSLDALTGVPGIAEWRAAGGLLISDSLGARSVKRFFNPPEQTFIQRSIALDAFNAGHDLLFVADFGLAPRQEQTANILDTLGFFGQRYRSDESFAARVDAAVLRILAAKLRLYGSAFTPDGALRPADSLNTNLGLGRTDVIDVAQSAATLIYPAPPELIRRLPLPPGPNDRIMFITDQGSGQQCPRCEAFELIDPNGLEQTVAALYGAGGSGQVQGRNLQSFTFSDLEQFLSGRLGNSADESTPTPNPNDIAIWLTQTNWVVFAMRDISPGNPASVVISDFLSFRSDLVRDRNVVVFAFNAPYYLDATDLNQVDAYYAMYSTGPAFVETAARILFRDVVPAGASPVSVLAVGYDLTTQLQPDPNRVIEIFAEQPASPTATVTPGPTVYQLGDAVNLRTNVILDRNGNVVVDGTSVSFNVAFAPADGGLVSQQTIDDLTENGVGAASFVLSNLGAYTVTVRTLSGPSPFQFLIRTTETGAVAVTNIPPSPTPSATPEPTLTPAPVDPVATPDEPTEPSQPLFMPANSIDFALMLVFSLVALVIGYRLGRPEQDPRRAVRLALLGLTGALVGYNLFALQVPGFQLSRGLFGQWGASLWVIAGAAAGLLIGYGWMRRRE